MTVLSERDRNHVFEQLRKGLVPERGIEAIAVGVEKQRDEIGRQLELAEDGEGTIKFLRGGYGCGKTFMARLALRDAQALGFATSFVVVSDNDLHFHRFDDVYRKIVGELGTSMCPRGALGDVLDRWIGRVEERLAASHDENAPDFDDKVKACLDEELGRMTGGQAPPDLVRVVQTIFALKQAGQIAEAGALIAWLSGSSNVAQAQKKVAGIKGDIESRDALAYLRGILEIIKAAGYKGLVVVIDEAETILRMRTDLRNKSLNGLRQIADDAGRFPGLVWIFTGTPDFFDARRGVAGLTPLHERIHFTKNGKFANLRQPQLELVPFDAARLEAVALKLRELFPTKARARLEAMIDQRFIAGLIADCTAGFGGDVGVVPRQFLRAFVNELDTVEQYPEYDPRQYKFKAELVTPEEAGAANGVAAVAVADEGEGVPVENVW